MLAVPSSQSTGIYRIRAYSAVLSLKDKVTTLGVILDSNLTLDAHVSAVRKNAHLHLRALRHIPSSLTDDNGHFNCSRPDTFTPGLRQLASLW